jgi:2-hydroxychromene-2-carboxylate isomerase
MDEPVLYFDLGSPYAYLAVARAARVLGRPPVLEPVLLGAIFRARGTGSWAHTDERAPRMADIERRARTYGLPPFAWPPVWPPDGLTAMRAATWAKAEGAVEPFARAVFARAFAAGEEAYTLEALAAAAEEAGLSGAVLREAVASDAVKATLREATSGAWEAGVRGIPTLRAGGELFYGDDRLEEAVRTVGS